MLSQRAKKMTPSPTLQLVAKAKELSEKGHDVISLSVGEPDWQTFKAPSLAGIEAIEKGFSKYTPAAGIVELRQAIAEQTSQDLGVEYKNAQVTVATGAKFILFAALQMLLDADDEVIIPGPYWVSYPVMTDLAQGKSILVNTTAKSNYKITPEQLEQAITPQSKVFLFSSPSNPTGLAYTKEELARLAEVFRRHPQIVIISDDIYNRLYFAGEKIAPHILHVAPDLKDRTLVVNGVSKSYAMTGWRIGWALGPLPLIKAMADYQSQATSSACSISQKAALAAILHCEQDVAASVVMLKERLELALEQLSQISGVKAIRPDGAFYIWLDVRTYFGKSHKGKLIKDSKDFAGIYLDEYFVATVPGAEFGADDFIRLSYATSKQSMAKAIDRLKLMLSSIR